MAQRPVRATRRDQRFGKPLPTWGLRGAGDGNRTRAISERLVGLGATIIREPAEPRDDHYAIAMTDPEGNEWDGVNGPLMAQAAFL